MTTASDYTAELAELIGDLAGNTGRGDEKWSQIRDLGLDGVGLPEEQGGSGGELADLVVAIRELGRAGLATPIVEASCAAFATGRRVPDGYDTVAVAERVTAQGARLTADLGHVPFATDARRLVVCTPAGVVVVDLGDSSARIEGRSDIAGLPVGRVMLADAESSAAVVDPDALTERLALTRSASLLGTALGAYELTLRHLREREQFGAPLIAIPAVSTAVAHMTVELQQAQSALDHALTVCDAAAGASQLRRVGAACSARITAASTATTVARAAHQLHGAMGVTKEYPLHRYSTALWAWRDVDLPESSWAARLGAASLANREHALWEQLTV